MTISITKSNTYKTVSSIIYVRHLGRHHFAHLRAVAEGIDTVDSAKRYLGVEHGHAAQNAHLQTRDAIRAIARRQNDPAWRLIGVFIQVLQNSNKPSLEEFVAEKDLDGWGESEVVELYNDAYPSDKKSNRRFLLRERQLKLLHKIEGLAAQDPKPTDLVSGWFDDLVSSKLISAGMVTLGDLNLRIATGGRWFSTMPGVGAAKAERIESHLRTLLPSVLAPAKKLFLLKASDSFAVKNEVVFDLSISNQTALPYSLINAASDDAAIDIWINARAGSKLTATVYKREAVRLSLWLKYERDNKSFADMKVDDCSDYMAFLQNIPDRWISRERAKPGEPGWAPFRGQLKNKSYRQSIVIVTAMFSWLLSANYLKANPWAMINQKTGDDKNEKMLDTKALSEMAVIEILRYIDAQAPSPSRSRIRFILRFVESVGLRSAELLNAKLGDFKLEPEGWVVQVYGKGAKNRVAVVPGQAYDALQQYLDMRGIGTLQNAPVGAPLIASTLDPMEPIGYQALYEHVGRWFKKAISNSDLAMNERMKLSGASTHWLRHTFGTRAIAREVPLDVIQAQMGHASIQTTTAIYGRAPIKRRVDELGKAFC